MPPPDVDGALPAAPTSQGGRFNSHPPRHYGIYSVPLTPARRFIEEAQAATVNFATTGHPASYTKLAINLTTAALSLIPMLTRPIFGQQPKVVDQATADARASVCSPESNAGATRT